MENFGVYTPPPLENHDEFAQSLQLCPTSLLSLVANGLRRYVDDIQYAGRQKGLSYDRILDFCTGVCPKCFRNDLSKSGNI